MIALPLRQKFALLLGGLGLAIGVIVYTNFDTSNTVASRLDATREQFLPRLIAANSLRERFKTMSLLLENAAVEGESSYLDESDTVSLRLFRDLDLLTTLTPEAGRAELMQLGRRVAEYHGLARMLAERFLEEGSDDLFHGDEIESLAGQVRDRRGDLESRLDELADSAHQALTTELRSTEQDVTARAQLTLVVGVVSLLCALTAMMLLTGRIVASIRALSSATAEVAKGNLEEMISVPTSRDEVGELVESFRQMSTRLRETTVSRDYVDNIINSMGDSLIVLDTESRIVMVNPATSRLLGFDETELVGCPFRDVLAKESTFVESSIQQHEGVTGSTVEESYVTKDGRVIPVSLAAAVLHREDGQTAGYVCVAQDLTERKSAEEDLRRARDEAEAASLAKSTFLANTSHEIRTPINAIMGMAQALQDEDLTPRAADQVDTVLQASEALTVIIDDLLDLSKIEAGQLEMETLPFDPVIIVEKARRTLAVRAEEKGISLTVTVHPDTVRDVEGDSVRLRQILMNVMGNALKFTDKGSVDVHLSSTTEPNGVRLFLQVCDTGIGIDTQRLTDIFDPFTQADASVTRTHGGTGLGLSISKRLVEMMDGHIGVDSQPGRGSTFYFDVLVAAVTGRSVTVTPEVEVDVRPLRILLAEDNALNRKVARALLLRDAHDITEVVNGAMAVDAVRTAPAFDVILMDMQMPVMDGMTATEEIRRLEAEAGRTPVPIVAITANAMKADKDRCLAAGMDDFLAKPVRREQLRAALARAVGGRATAAETSSAPTGSTSVILDPKILEDLRELEDEEFTITGFIRLFLDDAPNHLTRARQALAADDKRTLHREVHTMKGTSREVGAIDLASRSEALEKALKEGRPIDVAAGLDELQQSLARVSEVLEEMVRTEERQKPGTGDC